jgi:hypothetical protein
MRALPRHRSRRLLPLSTPGYFITAPAVKENHSDTSSAVKSKRWLYSDKQWDERWVVVAIWWWRGQWGK